MCAHLSRPNLISHSPRPSYLQDLADDGRGLPPHAAHALDLYGTEYGTEYGTVYGTSDYTCPWSGFRCGCTSTHGPKQAGIQHIMAHIVHN